MNIVQNKADGTFEFTTIKYTEADLEKDDAGNYIATKKKYTVKEKAGNLPGVTYDEREYEIEVTLEDDGEGTIEVTKPENLEIVFENEYETKGERNNRSNKARKLRDRI